MRHALVLPVRAGVVADHAHDRVVGFGRAVGSLVADEVGDAQEQAAQLLVDAAGLGGELLLAFAQGPALALEGLGLVDLAVAAQPAHLLRQLVDLPPGVVAFALELAEPGIERGGLVDLAEVDAAARQVLLHPVQVGSQEPDVDHADRR